VIPAVLLPFHEDLSIDEQAYRAHLRDVVSTIGIAAITTNAHASEVASCSFDEQRRVLEMTMEEVGDRIPVINGIYAEGSLEAQRLAKMASAGGAAALLVFPSGIYTFGQRPEMAVEHFRRIAEVSELPLILFQYPLQGGQGYPLSTLEKIIEAVPTVRAIKDWCANPVLHDRQIRMLQGRTPKVNVLTTHSAWLFPSLVLGCAGLLSGSGSVIAQLQAQLFQAVRAGRLEEARSLHDLITPTAEVFYADPWVDMHNRMKEALVMLGSISDQERARIRAALVAAKLLQ
ncbi:MAG: dihydrodipicolinate synthase family protein, partial [Betaproteobacteria bacterium]|nr:dihydrodipicolinate synthase family protein [Betaproteobacteria bacterium]